MNHSQTHSSSISENHCKIIKKQIPISLNSNPFPLEFIFNNKKSNLAVSYVNMGNKIQKNKNLNVISVSKKNKTSGNKNLITQSYLSKNSINSSNFSNNNFNKLKISSYKILNENSDFSSILFKKKINKNLYDKRKYINISINKVNKNKSLNNNISKNNGDSKSKIRNFKNKKNNDFNNVNFITINNNISKEKEKINFDLLKEKNNKVIKNKNRNKKVIFPLQIYNYFITENSFFGSSFINNKKKILLINSKEKE